MARSNTRWTRAEIRDMCAAVKQHWWTTRGVPKGTKVCRVCGRWECC